MKPGYSRATGRPGFKNLRLFARDPGGVSNRVIARDPVIAVIENPSQQHKSTTETRRHGVSRACGVFAATALLLAFLCFPNTLRSQEPQPAQNSASAPHTQSGGNETQPGKPAEKSAEGDENEAFHHSDSVKAIARLTGLSLDATYWLCVVLNFIVVFGVLWFMLRKALPRMFRNRSEAIQKRLEEARKASEDARRRLSDVEARLSRLDAEISQMRQEAEASGKTEEEHMMAAAEEERRRIVESAEQEIASAAAAARRELKAYTADLAVSLAEKKIQIGESTDEQLVRNFASRLGKDGN